MRWDHYSLPKWMSVMDSETFFVQHFFTKVHAKQQHLHTWRTYRQIFFTQTVCFKLLSNSTSAPLRWLFVKSSKVAWPTLWVRKKIRRNASLTTSSKVCLELLQLPNPLSLGNFSSFRILAIGRKPDWKSTYHFYDWYMSGCLRNCPSSIKWFQLGSSKNTHLIHS